MMKKFIILLVVLVAAISIQAQDYSLYKVGAPTQIITADTITDTGTDNVSILLRIPYEEPWGLAVQMIAANVSGTTDIDVNYQKSLDGTNWTTVSSDSLAASNLTYMFEDVDGFAARYLRVLYTGVGTQSSIVNGYIYIFKLPD